MLRHTAEILRSVPLARARVIPQACHAMNLEAPAAFNQALDEFLQRVLNPRP